MKNQNIRILIDKYKALTIDKESVAKELNLSLSTIDKYILKGGILPSPIKFGNLKRSSIRFSIIDIADFISKSGVSK